MAVTQQFPGILHTLITVSWPLLNVTGNSFCYPGPLSPSDSTPPWWSRAGALALHTRQDEGVTTSHLISRLSLTLAKGLASLIVHRIPRHPNLAEPPSLDCPYDFTQKQLPWQLPILPITLLQLNMFQKNITYVFCNHSYFHVCNVLFAMY